MAQPEGNGLNAWAFTGTAAEVMPIRKADGSGYLLTLEPALEGFPGVDPEADTQRINAIIERWVREYPAQCLWIHRRFRARPGKFG